MGGRRSSSVPSHRNAHRPSAIRASARINPRVAPCFIAARGMLNVQPCPTARVPRKRLPNDASRAYLTFRFNLEPCMIEPRD
jgi:hypothetical protein